MPLHHPSSHVRRSLGAVALLTASCELWKSTWWFAVFFLGEDYIQPRGLCYLSLYWDCETLPLWKSSFVNNQPGFDRYGIFVAPVQVFFWGLAARLPCCSEKLPSLIIIIVTPGLHDLCWIKICLKQFSFLRFQGPIYNCFFPCAASSFGSRKISGRQKELNSQVPFCFASSYWTTSLFSSSVGAFSICDRRVCLKYITGWCVGVVFWASQRAFPRMLMFQIDEQNKPLAGYIYQKFMPNVGIYPIHGSYGIWSFRKMHRYRNLELVCVSTPTCCSCTVDGWNLVAPGMCNCCN